METLLMKGKPVADAYRETIIARVARALEKGRKVTLAIIVVGEKGARLRWQLSSWAATRLRMYIRTA